MIDNKSILAVIPARSGSKRIPNKNILFLGGKPLISWSIEAGLNSRYIDKVIVSSDSDDILNISKKYHVKTIKRPVQLASDTANTFDVVEHVVENLDEAYDFVVLLQPTSPLRNSAHIDEALTYCNDRKANAVVSVCETSQSPLWSNTLPDNNNMDNFFSESFFNKRSQDLKKYYCLNGAIYLSKTNLLLKEKTFFLKNKIYAYKMDRWSSVDIDEEIDFQFAKLLIEKKHV